MFSIGRDVLRNRYHLHRLIRRYSEIRIDKPSYQITFTCKQCQHRSQHLMSKQAYHSGTVLIQCPDCKSRHLMADHLGIFSDKRVKLEDILGKEVRKGITQEDGTIEWESK